MPDPLSVTLGVLTILGACSEGAKSLRAVYVAPQEYTRFELELNHLQDVLKFVAGLVTEHQLLMSNALVKNLALAQNKLQEVLNFIHSSLGHSNSSRIRRRTLVRHRNRLAIFAKELEVAKAHILDSVLLSNLCAPHSSMTCPAC